MLVNMVSPAIVDMELNGTSSSLLEDCWFAVVGKLESATEADSGSSGELATGVDNDAVKLTDWFENIDTANIC